MGNGVARSKRQVLKVVHTWTGIVAGTFLSVLALTGSVILFRAQFERAALPKSAAVAGLSRRVTLDDAAREVGRVFPDARIRRVRLPVETGDPYIFQVESSEARTSRVVCDASSGRILGTVETGWVEWVIDLHRNVLSGKTGRKAVGIEGIVLFALSATGLLMWLSGARKWRSWITVRKEGSTRRFNFELHRASGLWAYGFLTTMSFTGIGLAFPDTYRQAVTSLTGMPAVDRAPKGIKAKGKAKSTGSLDEYLRAGRAAMPDGTVTEIRLPDSAKGTVDLHLRRAGDLALSGNHVYLDPGTAAVVRVDRVVDRPLGARFLASLAPIHYGEFGGVPVKAVWALLGLSPVLLFVTGLIAWWRPSKRKSNQPVPEAAGSEDPVLAHR